MSEELFEVLFNYVYIPFIGAFIIIASFFWRLREKDRATISAALKEVDARLAKAVSHDDVRDIIEDKLEHLNKSQDGQLKILESIQSDTSKMSRLLIRIDERVKAVEAVEAK